MRSSATFRTCVTVYPFDFELIGVKASAEARAKLRECGTSQTRKKRLSGIDVRWFPVENAVRGVVANGIGHNISVEALDCRSTSAWLDDADGVQVRLDQWPNFRL